jgi:hypothetical protein
MEFMMESAFIPAIFFVVALLFLAVRDQLEQPWRSLVTLIALFTLIEAYIYWMPQVSILSRVLLAIPVLAALWELAPKTAPGYVVGDARAWLLVSPAIVASLVLLVVAPRDGFEDYSVLSALGSYFPWALFQQWVVAELIHRQSQAIFGKLGIISSAAVFGFFQFPNFALMAATFLLGIALLAVYERHRNLLAIATAQTFLIVSFDTIALQFVWLPRTVGPGFTAGL